MTIDFQKLQNEVSDCRSLLLSIQSRLDMKPGSGTTMLDDETPLSVKQAADFLCISPQTIYQRIKLIPHKKRFGRLYFYASDLRAYIDGGEGVGNE